MTSVLSVICVDTRGENPTIDRFADDDGETINRTMQGECDLIPQRPRSAILSESYRSDRFLAAGRRFFFLDVPGLGPALVFRLGFPGLNSISPGWALSSPEAFPRK